MPQIFASLKKFIWNQLQIMRKINGCQIIFYFFSEFETLHFEFVLRSNKWTVLYLNPTDFKLIDKLFKLLQIFLELLVVAHQLSDVLIQFTVIFFKHRDFFFDFTVMFIQSFDFVSENFCFAFLPVHVHIHVHNHSSLCCHFQQLIQKVPQHQHRRR